MSAHDDEQGGGASRSTHYAAGTSSGTDVSLREYEDEKIKATRFAVAAIFVFGAFAWSEIQRRLEILNHENARLLQQQERTVSQDTYIANEQQRKEEQTEYKKWKEDVDRDRTQSVSREEFQQDSRLQRRGSLNTGISGAAVLVSLGVAILVLLTYIAAHH